MELKNLKKRKLRGKPYEFCGSWAVFACGGRVDNYYRRVFSFVGQIAYRTIAGGCKLFAR